MSQPLVSGHRQRGALSVLLLAALVLSTAVVALALRAQAAGAASPTQPVSYYMFRTRDTGSSPTNEQNTRCNNYFGARALTTIKRLNALLFAYNADPLTGRLTDQTANLLGPGFICAVPKLSTSEVDAYAYSSLPGPGVVEATGPCGLEPVAVSNNPLILACRLGVRPIPAKNVLGGLITSNSLVNLLDTTGTAPTGSVWTAQIVGNVANSGGGGGTVPPGIKPETPGLDFYSLRTKNEASVAPSSVDCTKAGLAGTPIAVRTADLWTAQPDPASGRIPDTAGATVGKQMICFVYATGTGYRAFSLTTLKAGGKTLNITARGDCTTTCGRTRSSACRRRKPPAAPARVAFSLMRPRGPVDSVGPGPRGGWGRAAPPGEVWNAQRQGVTTACREVAQGAA